MPEINGHQFMKANPNQMALPGMEETAHPGAKLLTQGYTFDAHTQHGRNGSTTLALSAYHKDDDYDSAGSMTWDREKAPGYNGMFAHSPGEIHLIRTDPEHERKGIATALYGIGRTMSTIKPRPSTKRTPAGDKWQKKAAKVYGGKVPKKNTLNYD